MLHGAQRRGGLPGLRRHPGASAQGRRSRGARVQQPVRLSRPKAHRLLQLRVRDDPPVRLVSSRDQGLLLPPHPGRIPGRVPGCRPSSDEAPGRGPPGDRHHPSHGRILIGGRETPTLHDSGIREAVADSASGFGARSKASFSELRTCEVQHSPGPDGPGPQAVWGESRARYWCSICMDEAPKAPDWPRLPARGCPYRVGFYAP
jgi:hypothetical protein